MFIKRGLIMKKKCLFFVLLMFSLKLFCQSHGGINYQAVIRNNGEVLQNENVSISISIIENEVSGSVVYEESHSVTTDDHGIVNLIIGSGDVSSGDFSKINWGSRLFVKIESDAGSGSLEGTFELLSVPHAFYSGSSDVARSLIKILSENFSVNSDLFLTSGISVNEMKYAGLDVSTIFSGGVTIEQLRDAGVGVQEMVDENLPVSNMIAGGITVSQLVNAGEDLTEMQAAGVTISQLLDADVSVQELVDVNSPVSDMLTAGITVSQLVQADEDVPDMLSAAITLSQLLTAKESVSDLLSGGITVLQLVNEDADVSEMMNAGVTTQQLVNANEDVSDMLDEGITIAQLVTAGESVQDMTDAGITLSQMVDAGENADDLLLAGFTITEIMDEGITQDDIIAGSITTSSLIGTYGLVVDGITGSYTDTRDGKVYTYIGVGEQVWFAENLASAKTTSGANITSGIYAPNGSSSNVSAHGYLYTYTVGQNACPSGWHVATDAEWFTLENFLDPTIDDPTETGHRGTVFRTKMQEAGFDIPFSGYYTSNISSYNGFGSLSAYWAVSTTAFARLINDPPSNTSVRMGFVQTNPISVKCIRN
jgi:uncharacterized protein (TIGR02145 family)